MRKISKCHFGLAFLLAIIILSALFYPKSAKAATNNRLVHCINTTETSITIDWSRAANYQQKEYKSEFPNGYYKNFEVVIYDPDDGKEHWLNGPKSNAVTVGGSVRQYTFKGLTPGANYTIHVTYHFKHNDGSAWETQSSFPTGRVCTVSNREELPILGTSGTTATVDYRQLIKNLKDELKDKKSVNINYFLGYSDQTSGKDAALKNASAMIGKEELHLNAKQGNYMLRGLSPNHTYTVVIAAKISYRDNNTSKVMLKHFQNENVTTSGEDDSATFKKAPTFVPIDTSTHDSVSYGKSVSSGEYSSSTVAIKTESHEDSITIDWSTQKSETLKISPAKGKSHIQVMCVENKHYSPEEDYRQYGCYSNYGPNIREAMKRIDSSPINVKDGDTSYTFTGLKNNSCYTIILKCSYSDNGKSTDTFYSYLRYVYTYSGSKPYLPSEIKNKTNNAFMYDVNLKRNGKTADLDWSSALDQFFGQEPLKDYFPKIGGTSYSYESLFSIGYAPLPDTYSEAAVRQSYKDALAMAKDLSNYNALTIESSNKNYRVYGLDPSKKYVFAIYLDALFYVYGDSNTLYDQVFYADEKGMNFYKARKTDTPYDESEIKPSEDEPKTPGDSESEDPGDDNKDKPGDDNKDKPGDDNKDKPGDDNKDKPGDDSKDKPSDDKKTPEDTAKKDETLPDITQEDDSSKSSKSKAEDTSKSSQENAPVDATTQPAEKSAKNNDLIAVNKQKANKAWIYQDKEKISASKLKKKAQTVTLKIENSKGKITIADISDKAHAGNVSFKIKGRKAYIKLKKGAPKGTYKFKVTVGAKGKAQKTTTTVKIKVK